MHNVITDKQSPNQLVYILDTAMIGAGAPCWRLQKLTAHSVNVNVTFDPPWNPEMMSDYAREKLGFNPVKSSEKSQKVNVEWE